MFFFPLQSPCMEFAKFQSKYLNLPLTEYHSNGVEVILNSNGVKAILPKCLIGQLSSNWLALEFKIF